MRRSLMAPPHPTGCLGVRAAALALPPVPPLPPLPLLPASAAAWCGSWPACASPPSIWDCCGGRDGWWGKTGTARQVGEGPGGAQLSQALAHFASPSPPTTAPPPPCTSRQQHVAHARQRGHRQRLCHRHAGAAHQPRAGMCSVGARSVPAWCCNAPHPHLGHLMQRAGAAPAGLVRLSRLPRPSLLRLGSCGLQGVDLQGWRGAACDAHQARRHPP